jgi:hypothetical protein
MRRGKGGGGRALLGALLVFGLGAGASEGARAAEAPKPAIDPSAIAALQKMGAFLRSLQTMEVQSEMTTDDVLGSGQKVELQGTVNMKVRRPSRMSIDVRSDRKNERIYYDGTTFTVFQPTIGYYASFPAPPTLGELVDVLEQKYGIDLPMADLFRLGTNDGQLAAIRGASFVGYSTVKGSVCSHFAFRQADVDWELWIQEGAQPLPRKLVITTTTEKTQPQHTSVMTWNLSPTLEDQAFVFTPPANAQRIEFDVTKAGAASRSSKAGGGSTP